MGKEKPNNEKNSRQISADLGLKHYETLQKIVEDKQLSSIGKSIAYILDEREQLLNGLSIREKDDCRYRFGDFCLRFPEKLEAPDKLKKTNDAYCQGCLNAQKLARENKEAQNESLQLEHEFFNLANVPEKQRLHPTHKWCYAMEFIDNLNFEIEELKKPVESYLEEITQFEAKLKNLHAQEESLESENANLKQQLEAAKKEIKQNPTYQQNQWLTRELQQANQKIAKLEASFQGVIAR